ncbi:MAG: putative secreted protein [Proteiniphilum sp.]|jgi:peroxiredoxin|nr:putative secreted protein [Proteiniphilum sp.]
MKYVNFCLAAILSLALSSGSVKRDLPSIGYHPGEMIPDIVLTDSEGERLTLHELKGKKVVLNFWASYDAQSRAANVQLYNFLSRNNADVTFLSVSFDENLNVLERTLAMDHLEKISCYLESEGTASELYEEFRFSKGFKSYLIDEKGVITAMNIDPTLLRNLL